MQDDAVISRAGDLMETHFNGELITLHMGTSKFHMFDAIAQRIWDLAEAPITLETLCRRLCDEFDVDLATCREDVSELIEYLVAEKVMVVQP